MGRTGHTTWGDSDFHSSNIMKSLPNCVFVVDDDQSMRDALRNLLRSVGLEARLFATAQEFLDGFRTGLDGLADVPGCLILDVRLPGLGGLDLQRELTDAGIHSCNLHHRSWRYSDVRQSNEGRSDGISHQAFP